MPVYEYQHLDEPCERGKIFEIKQSIEESPLAICPRCKGGVKRIISMVNISTPKTNTDIKDAGFTKLVRRDDGVYENVTRRDGDSRYMIRGKPETLPNFRKTLSDWKDFNNT